MSALVASVAAAVATFAPQGPGPRVQGVFPAGAGRGSEVTITLRGERLAAPQGVLLDGPGLEVLAVDAGDNGRCSVRLRVAADCPLGQHGLRLRTPAGLGNLVPFHAGPLPALLEQRDGDAPMTIAPNHTIDGELRDGDVDRFLVALPAGARVQVACEAQRLGMVDLDLRLVVRDEGGRELARGDDSALGGRDPAVTFTVPAAGPTGVGTVQIELTNAVPGDNRSGAYRLHVGTFAAPVGALPCGGQPGEELHVALLGTVDERGEPAVARVRLPDDGSERFACYAPLPGGGISPTPIWLQVGGPRNDGTTIDEAGRTWFSVPGAVHGIVDVPDQPAVFHWRGRKGQEVEFRVVARVLRSALDATLTIRGADGRSLANNDDQNGIDSTLRFAPPSDGDYTVEVRDLLRTASPAHFFRLEAGPRLRARNLALQVGRNGDPIVTVPQGGSGAMVLQRTGLEDTEALATAELPAGVLCTIGPRLPGSNQQAVLFTAAADAPLAAGQLRVGIATGDAAGGTAAGGVDARVFRQTLALLTGRNDTPLLQCTQRTVPLVVRKPAPFAVTAAPLVVPLIRGASLVLPLTLVRSEGFDGRVRVRSPWTPPGLTVGQANFDRGVTTANLAIEAAATAPLGEFPCLVVASTRTDNVPLEQALPFVMVRVEEPWATVAAGKARAAQGETAALRLAVTDVQARRGPATATLLGLPRGVTAADATLAADAKELAFVLTAAADAAVGRHRDLRVELRLPDAEGRPVLHRFAAGELRVDKARSMPPPAANPAPNPAAQPVGDAR